MSSFINSIDAILETDSLKELLLLTLQVMSDNGYTVIFYRTLEKDYIEITRILHERMDLKKRITEWKTAHYNYYK